MKIVVITQLSLLLTIYFVIITRMVGCPRTGEGQQFNSLSLIFDYFLCSFFWALLLELSCLTSIAWAVYCKLFFLRSVQACNDPHLHLTLITTFSPHWSSSPCSDHHPQHPLITTFSCLSSFAWAHFQLVLILIPNFSLLWSPLLLTLITRDSTTRTYRVAGAQNGYSTIMFHWTCFLLPHTATQAMTSV